MPKIVTWQDVECTACGVRFKKRPNDIARAKTGRFFCSVECRNRIGSKPRRRQERACQMCGASFDPRGPGTAFCSLSCRNEAQRIYQVDQPCEHCGKLHNGRGGRRYCSRECWIQGQYRRPLDRFHNDKPAVLDHQGYVRVCQPDHPAATRAGWVFEHRIVVERVLGRYLARDEHVHHLNHVRHDNRPENLTMLTASEHSQITGSENSEALKAALVMRQRLDEYERRFGPLTEEPPPWPR